MAELSFYGCHYKTRPLGFPGDLVVKNPPAKAEYTSLIPDPRKSHMPQSNWARAPQLLAQRPRACVLQQEKPLQWEARPLQPGKTLRQQRRASTDKNKKN